MSEHLTLKWGTLKAWRFEEGSSAHKAFERYCKAGNMAAGAMQQDDNEAQKHAICDIIDAVDCGTIYNDWTGEEMSKDEAKKHVMGYGS